MEERGNFEMAQRNHERLKRENRKCVDIILLGNVGNQEKGLICVEFGRVCFSRVRLKCHKRSHIQKVDLDYAIYGIATCHECVKVCRSAVCLNRHMRKHGNQQVDSVAEENHVCNICVNECWPLTGLKNQIRAAHRCNRF